MYLKQPALADSVRRMARTLAACPPDDWPRLWALLQTVAVRQGDYDWIELQTEFDSLLKHDIFDGATILGVDEGANRLHFGFATQAAVEAFRAKAKALGAPDGMLRLDVEEGATWGPARPPSPPQVSSPALPQFPPPKPARPPPFVASRRP